MCAPDSKYGRINMMKILFQKLPIIGLIAIDSVRLYIMLSSTLYIMLVI